MGTRTINHQVHHIHLTPISTFNLTLGLGLRAPPRTKRARSTESYARQTPLYPIYARGLCLVSPKVPSRRRDPYLLMRTRQDTRAPRAMPQDPESFQPMATSTTYTTLQPG